MNDTIKATCNMKCKHCREPEVYIGHIEKPEGSATGIFVTPVYRWPILEKTDSSMYVQCFPGDTEIKRVFKLLKIEYLTD